MIWKYMKKYFLVVNHIAGLAKITPSAKTIFVAFFSFEKKNVFHPNETFEGNLSAKNKKITLSYPK